MTENAAKNYNVMSEELSAVNMDKQVVNTSSVKGNLKSQCRCHNYV